MVLRLSCLIHGKLYYLGACTHEGGLVFNSPKLKQWVFTAAQGPLVAHPHPRPQEKWAGSARKKKKDQARHHFFLLLEPARVNCCWDT